MVPQMQSDSETGTRTREANLVTRMGAQSSPTSDDWGRHCGSQNVEFLAKLGPRCGPLTGDLATAGRQKAAQKTVSETKPESYALLANAVPCSCQKVLSLLAWAKSLHVTCCDMALHCRICPSPKPGM